MRSISNRPWGNISSGCLGAFTARAVKEVYKESGTPGEFTVKIAAYTYDVLGRRIRMEATHGGLSGGLNEFMANYYYDGAQCIEEQDISHDPYRQYVWGQYVDELIQQRDIGDTDYYMLSDLLYRAVALTNASAEIQEACDCDAYGNTIVYEAAGAGGDWFADDARSIYSEDPALLAWANRVVCGQFQQDA